MRNFYYACMLALLTAGCSSSAGTGKQEEKPRLDLHEPRRAMYFWKNSCSPTQEECDFLERHGVGRIYMRFFDVTLESQLDGKRPQPIPTATVRIDSLWTEPEIVPTVFITPAAIIEYAWHKDSTLAEKLVKRIDNMCSYYGLQEPKEIQLDCDWTGSSEKPFFDFCAEVRRRLPKNRLLSCTIRLHQLRRPAPPVDYGVLMLYNTNNLRDPEVSNSILSAEDVKPYLRNVSYDLHLDLAFPIYSWDLLFRDGKFQGILRSQSQADSLSRAGEAVRHEEVSFDEIMKVKCLVEKHLPKPKHERSIILYHLDQNNLKRYTDHEIETVFSR